MTREEEIHEAAKEFAFSDKTETPDLCDVINDFYYGAKWADKTMLDRAENYLRSKLEYRPILKEEYIHGEDYIRRRQEQSRLCDEFITAFRRAMEGGADDVR